MVVEQTSRGERAAQEAARESIWTPDKDRPATEQKLWTPASKE